MDNHEHEKENNERRNSNTEYIPTKCRITKPPPPKPATNPLQFVKVAPCPLFQKAHEQIKKVEEIKKERKEIREESEDWQLNLDNWKSSRRKRQEHIIERVVEVKKLEQEEHGKSRRKSKTFSEMIEDRSRGRHKFTIPVYDDDSNDLSDYGIGSSSSKTNSIKDVDTDDSSSILDEKDHRSLELPNTKDNSSISNQSHSEDEAKSDNNNVTMFTSNYATTLSNSVLSKPKPSVDNKSVYNNQAPKENTKQYTYEGAIQDYRSRIQSKIHVDESIFSHSKDYSKSKEFSEAQSVLPKGEIFKRKELFDKPVDMNSYESAASRRLSEDFANTRSIKDRLKSLEQSVDQTLKNTDKGDIQVSVKQRLQTFNKKNEDNLINNNVPRKPRPNKISNYLLDKSNSTPTITSKPVHDWKTNDNQSDHRCSSPETEIYMNELNLFNKDLDNLLNGKRFIGMDANIEDYCNNSNYPPSTSSVELTGLSSEDSGIHTADVSCSVSQADEAIDTDNEIISNTIPNCIEKLKETEQKNNEIIFEDNLEETREELSFNSAPQINNAPKNLSLDVFNITKDLLEDLKRDSSEGLEYQQEYFKVEEVIPELQTIIETVPNEPKQVVYENVELKPFTEPFIDTNITSKDYFDVDAPFSLVTLMKEPPKVKPPPPPPPENESKEELKSPEPAVRRMNSTKRIKKEMQLKRSSFLGLDEPTDDQIDPDLFLDKPPDISSFLQKEAKMEKSLYKKIHEERGGILSKVESQDSGLDIDRGRLSSDTWCSSIGDSSTPSHERQDSEQTSSITSEEDEITKKEREIIEMVEKEEKSRDPVTDLVNHDTVLNNNYSPSKKENLPPFEPSLGSEQFDSPYFPQQSSDSLDDQDSEVLKVERELRQLEREELERQRENMLFQESRAKARLQNNRRSLDNICDEIYPCYPPDCVDYRKSMPELQQVPLEYRKSVPDVPNVYRNIPDLDVQYRKSMPDMQIYQNLPEPHKPVIENDVRIEHRKSMPELQMDIHRSAFKSPPPQIGTQPIVAGKPIRNFIEPKAFNASFPEINNAKKRQLSKHTIQALSAAPRQRHNDNWIQPKLKSDAKPYNQQHWIIQEAELRRISDQQQKNVLSSNRNWQQPRHDKHIPDSIIQSLTQRVQNRTIINDRNPQIRRPESNKKDFMQHPYLGNPQTVGHAQPMPYTAPLLEDTQDRMLSVSGKKKCSYCGHELGRGAAMIIESLCLFYHMECFKCCVCHVQLGDGLMGTDVRVRNQKLHCHNCYSSDDGVKFSCV